MTRLDFGRTDESHWEDHGSRVVASDFSPSTFVRQHIAPLFYEQSFPAVGPGETAYSEQEFWEKTVQRSGRQTLDPFSSITLERFTVSDWFPRTPGLYWSRAASVARSGVYDSYQQTDIRLGKFYEPVSKLSLVEHGGLGTIRLLPKRIDGERCWFATAITGHRCDAGIPLAIPEVLLRRGSFVWGQAATLKGRLHFMQDAELGMVGDSMQGVRPLIIFVDEIVGETTGKSRHPIIISPIVLFTQGDLQSKASVTFVQCNAGDDADLDSAADWMNTYCAKYKGQIVTNFDEQRPLLAGAPLSYQRLVASTHDRYTLEKFAGRIVVERVDTLVVETSTHLHGDINMRQNTINVGGNAIINIDSVLSGVTQTIAESKGLDATQKTQLDALVQQLRVELKPLETSHPDEVREVAEAAEKAVAAASRPAEERKRTFLDLKASNLLEAVKLLTTLAPTAVHLAKEISAFLHGLM